ncbi:hypothetical protein HZS_3859 [Henneguya salminicola]|nr:hypothetical protein HZS_3859 [Henneguya salminicola]
MEYSWMPKRRILYMPTKERWLIVGIRNSESQLIHSWIYRRKRLEFGNRIKLHKIQVVVLRMRC